MFELAGFPGDARGAGFKFEAWSRGCQFVPPFVARGSQFATPSKGVATASHGAGVPFCALVVVGRFSVVKVSRNRTQTEQFGLGLCRYFNSLQCNRAETEQQTEQK